MYFILYFLNDKCSMSDTSCMICENENIGVHKQWKCETCSFSCHTQCVQKWLQISRDNRCPQCRSVVDPHLVYTRNEFVAMLISLSLSTNISSCGNEDIDGLD